MADQHLKNGFQVIVCAIFRNADGKIFIARRKPEKRLGGFWEFPGGKLNPGEGLEEALRREIREELHTNNFTIDGLLHVKPFVYDHFPVLILFYLCHTEQKEFALTDHDQYLWSRPQDLKKLKLLPANEEVLEKLNPA